METIVIPDTIRTFSGLDMNVFEPTPDMIVIEDIAHALSLLCRFGGHVPKFYSVAQHSVMCSDLIDIHSDFFCLKPKDVKPARFEALMHDASEAYLIDLPKPIKNKLEDYKRVEDNLMRLIADKFGFQYPLNDCTKYVDGAMFHHEWDTLMIKHPASLGLECWSAEEAEKRFLETFKELSTN